MAIIHPFSSFEPYKYSQTHAKIYVVPFNGKATHTHTLEADYILTEQIMQDKRKFLSLTFVSAKPRPGRTSRQRSRLYLPSDRIELVFQTLLTLFFQLSEHLSQLVYQLTSSIPTIYELLVSRKNEKYEFLVLILTAYVSFFVTFYIWKLQRLMICTLIVMGRMCPLRTSAISHTKYRLCYPKCFAGDELVLSSMYLVYLPDNLLHYKLVPRILPNGPTHYH